MVCWTVNVQLQVQRVNLYVDTISVNPLNAKLNPICHLLALLEPRHILHFSGLRVKMVQSSLELNNLC